MTDPCETLDLLPIAVFAREGSGTVRAVNRAALRMAGGRTDGELLTGLIGLAHRGGAALEIGPIRMTIADDRNLEGLPLEARSRGGHPEAVSVSTRMMRDAGGVVTGVLATVSPDLSSNVTVDEIDRARLAAIVASSNDAIVSKTLDGRVVTWNDAATRIFGYTAGEMIGQSILQIVPPELHCEEQAILGRLGRGERVEHFDTVRVAKDGHRIDVSLTISPLRNSAGEVVGASKIGRDITDRKRAEALQMQLFDELNHRVKNTLATMQAIASLSLSQDSDPATFAARFSERLRALGAVHDLIVLGKMQGADLRELIGEAVSARTGEIVVDGRDIVIDPGAAVPLALALNELANVTGGAENSTLRVSISWRLDDGILDLEWRESGRANSGAPVPTDVSAAVIERLIDGLGGSIRVIHEVGGSRVRLKLPLFQDSTPAPGRAADAPEHAIEPGDAKRILVVEDEALIAMDIEAQLIAAGFDVVGPAGALDEALGYIETTPFDAALVDANIRGRPVGDIASSLRAKGVPFAFATGYGRSALPAGFHEQQMLAKPFTTEELIATVESLLRPEDEATTVNQR